MRIGRGRRHEGPAGDVRLVAPTQDGEQLVDLRRAAELDLLGRGAEEQRAHTLAATCVPGSLTAFLGSGTGIVEWVSQLASDPHEASLVPTEAMRLVCPVDPPSYRDFMSFDEHVVATYALSGRTPPSTTYQLPVYYKGSTATLIGPDDLVPWPGYATSLDYELEVAYVVGSPGVDLAPADALPHVFGVTILNDFSARDMQFTEMRGRLGPAKGKDFATAFGPWVVTLDELGSDGLEMAASVNGVEHSRGDTSSAMWGCAELVAWASAAEPLRAGDVLGSGTVGGGSGLEHGVELQAGDLVELTVDGLGVLRNTIGARRSAAYTPEPKRRRDSVTAPS